jgi:hypothetical protein
LKAKRIVPKSLGGLKEWKKLKNRMDIRGYDTPKLIKKIKVKRKKLQKIRKQKREITKKVIKREIRKVRPKKIVKPEIVIVKKPKKIKFRKPKRYIERKKLSGVEIKNLKKLANKYGVEQDLIDWEAIIDRTETYDENKTRVEKLLRKISVRKDMDKRSIREIESELQSDYERHLDELKWRAEQGDPRAKHELELFTKEYEEFKSQVMT